MILISLFNTFKAAPELIIFLETEIPSSILPALPPIKIPNAAFKITIVVKRLPKTRSGKVLRGTIRKIADKEEYKMPATIDDPAILDEIKEDLKKHNILK